MTATMQPVKRTPLYRTALALGATMTDHAGWQVAAHFRSPDEEARQVQAGRQNRHHLALQTERRTPLVHSNGYHRHR